MVPHTQHCWSTLMNWWNWMVWCDLSLLYWIRPSGLHLWRALAFSVTTSSQKSICSAVITPQVYLQRVNKCISGSLPMGWCVMSSVNESFRDSRQHHHTAAVIPTCAGLAPKPLKINGKDWTLINLAQKQSSRQSSEVTAYQGELRWKLQESSQLLAVLSIQGMIIPYT